LRICKIKVRGKLQIEIFPQIFFGKFGENAKIREMYEKELNGTRNNNNIKSSRE